MLVCCAWTSPLLAAPGGLDPTFNHSGKFVASMGSTDARCNAIALQTDGKIVVAGNAEQGSTKVIAVARVSKAGVLDSTFGVNGKVLTNLGPSYHDTRGVAVQSDGKILVAGTFGDWNTAQGFILRYNTDGTLDTSFNGSGILLTSINGKPCFFNCIALQSDGKILVAGFATDDTTVYHGLAICRYHQDGSPEFDFNGTGNFIRDFYGWGAEAQAIAVQKNGAILVAGRVDKEFGTDFALLRVTRDGALDLGFNQKGYVIRSITPGNIYEEATALALQADGRILVAGYTYPSGMRMFQLLRYHATGTIDTSYHGTGIITMQVGSGSSGAEGIGVLRDGSAIVAGFAHRTYYSSWYPKSYECVGLACIRSSGSANPKFNKTGEVTTAFKDLATSRSHAVVVQPDGKFIIAGETASDFKMKFAIARYYGTTR